MEQSIEVATEPLHAEIIEHRQMKGRQNQNTQKQGFDHEEHRIERSRSVEVTIHSESRDSRQGNGDQTDRQGRKQPAKKISVRPHLVIKYLK